MYYIIYLAFTKFIISFIKLIEQIEDDKCRENYVKKVVLILEKLIPNDRFIILRNISLSNEYNDNHCSFAITKIQHYHLKYLKNPEKNNYFIDNEMIYDILNNILSKYIMKYYSYNDLDSYFERIKSSLALLRSLLKLTHV